MSISYTNKLFLILPSASFSSLIFISAFILSFYNFNSSLYPSIADLICFISSIVAFRSVVNIVMSSLIFWNMPLILSINCTPVPYLLALLAPFLDVLCIIRLFFLISSSRMSYNARAQSSCFLLLNHSKTLSCSLKLIYFPIHCLHKRILHYSPANY